MKTQLFNLVEYFSQSAFLAGAAAGASLVLLLLFLLKLRCRPANLEASSGELGRVLVSSHALRDLIQRHCEEMPEVGRARAVIQLKGGQINIQIRLRIRSDARLVGVSGYLQERIGAVIRQNLGMENIGPIDVMVAGILSPSKPRARKSAEAQAEGAAPNADS